MMIPKEMTGLGKDYWFKIVDIDKENEKMNLKIDGEYIESI